MDHFDAVVQLDLTEEKCVEIHKLSNFWRKKTKT